jgi:hypothetical protein
MRNMTLEEMSGDRARVVGLGGLGRGEAGKIAKMCL